MPEPTYLTAEGIQKLKQELEELKGPGAQRSGQATSLRHPDGRSV